MLCIKLVNYWDYTEMHGQQNIKTPRISNTNWFSAATMVSRKSLIVPLYVHWLSFCVNRSSHHLKAQFCCLRRGFAAALLLRLWVRIPSGGMDVCCECCLCVTLRAGTFDELITHPEESYRLWRVVVCALETSWMRTPWPALGRSAKQKNSVLITTNTRARCPVWVWNLVADIEGGT